METQIQQRVCGLVGGLSYVSTADVISCSSRWVLSSWTFFSSVLQPNESIGGSVFAGT